jgi:hypothetical protein
MYFKYTAPKLKEKSTINDSVIFSQQILTFFTLKEQLSIYPDRIAIHYPYLIVVHPDKGNSEVYNMQSKKKEKDINEVILDYFKGNAVYNKQGLVSYFNDKSLQILCDQAFIKSDREVYCVTRPDTNKQNNELLLINTQSMAHEHIYKSPEVITAIYFDKETLYIGKYDFTAQKASIMVNNMNSSIDDLINVIYPMNNKFYAASFKSLRNNKVESYYEIHSVNKNISARLVARGKIVFNN